MDQKLKHAFAKGAASQGQAWADSEYAKMSTQAADDLPDSAFAYIEPGAEKDAAGKTTPRSKRHFPIHDAPHVRNALARIAQGAQFGKQALPKVQEAAKKFGVAQSAPGKDA